MIGCGLNARLEQCKASLPGMRSCWKWRNLRRDGPADDSTSSENSFERVASIRERNVADSTRPSIRERVREADDGRRHFALVLYLACVCVRLPV